MVGRSSPQPVNGRAQRADGTERVGDVRGSGIDGYGLGSSLTTYPKQRTRDNTCGHTPFLRFGDHVLSFVLFRLSLGDPRHGPYFLRSKPLDPTATRADC